KAKKERKRREREGRPLPRPGFEAALEATLDGAEAEAPLLALEGALDLGAARLALREYLHLEAAEKQARRELDLVRRRRSRAAGDAWSAALLVYLRAVEVDHTEPGIVDKRFGLLRDFLKGEPRD